jgi:prepilin-type N-terminal cleavage/methylation domain-containing protein
MLRRNQRGFTLVELMIVVIIVGILAAVAIPMYQGATERAKASEAVAALGTIRGAMRVYFAEHGTYVIAGVAAGDQVTDPGVLDVTDTDLLGRYFSTECYTFDAVPTANAFDIECDGAASTASQAGEVASIVRSINQDGNITNS